MPKVKRCVFHSVIFQRFEIIPKQCFQIISKQCLEISPKQYSKDFELLSSTNLLSLSYRTCH